MFYYTNKVRYLNQNIFNNNAYFNSILFKVFSNKSLFGIGNNKVYRSKIDINFV